MQITLVGDEELNFIVPFLSEKGATIIGLNDIDLIDSNGGRYNLFGQSISESNTVDKLEVPYSMVGYWFAIAAFYPDVEIFADGEM